MISAPKWSLNPFTNTPILSQNCENFQHFSKNHQNPLRNPFKTIKNIANFRETYSVWKSIHYPIHFRHIWNHSTDEIMLFSCNITHSADPRGRERFRSLIPTVGIPGIHFRLIPVPEVPTDKSQTKTSKM